VILLVLSAAVVVGLLGTAMRPAVVSLVWSSLEYGSRTGISGLFFGLSEGEDERVSWMRGVSIVFVDVGVGSLAWWFSAYLRASVAS
jgi:hypothetical protein